MTVRTFPRRPWSGRWRRLPLIVTHAWRWPYGEADDKARIYRRKAAEYVLLHGAGCARACSTAVDVATDLYEGSAAQRLVELSDGAELVVVGSRDLGAPVRFMVGSIAACVAARARSSVIIVRGVVPVPVPLRSAGLVVVAITALTWPRPVVGSRFR